MYDTDDPSLMGNGDAWAGGITNGGCAASVSGAGNYVPAISVIDPVTYVIPKSWCDKTYEIQNQIQCAAWKSLRNDLKLL